MYAMLQRLLELRMAIEIWYVAQGGGADKDAERLTNYEWRTLADVVDVLGMFKPLTVSLEKAGEAGIVHILP